MEIRLIPGPLHVGGVSRSPLSRLLAQKAIPSTKRACLRKPWQQQAYTGQRRWTAMS